MVLTVQLQLSREAGFRRSYNKSHLLFFTHYTFRFTQKYLCRRVAMTTVTLIPVQQDSRPREGNLPMMLKEREKKCYRGNLPPPPLRRRSCTRSVMVSKRRDFLLMTSPVTMLFLFRPKLLSNKSSRNAPSMMVSGCCIATSYTHTLITSYTHTLTTSYTHTLTTSYTHTLTYH